MRALFHATARPARRAPPAAKCRFQSSHHALSVLPQVGEPHGGELPALRTFFPHGGPRENNQPGASGWVADLRRNRVASHGLRALHEHSLKNDLARHHPRRGADGLAAGQRGAATRLLETRQARPPPLGRHGSKKIIRAWRLATFFSRRRRNFV